MHENVSGQTIGILSASTGAINFPHMKRVDRVCVFAPLTRIYALLHEQPFRRRPEDLWQSGHSHPSACNNCTREGSRSGPPKERSITKTYPPGKTRNTYRGMQCHEVEGYVTNRLSTYIKNGP
jgi:hypothetical protein